MTRRKGAGKGKGQGYKNLPGFPKDPKVHSDSRKGIKQPQKGKNVPSGISFSSRFMPLKKQHYLALARLAGLKKDIAERYAKFMLKRFPKESDKIYAYEWAVRFRNGTEYASGDEKSRKILEKLADYDSDTDGDGVIDMFDCDPDDPTKQGDDVFMDIEDFETQKLQRPTFLQRLKTKGKTSVKYVSDLAKQQLRDHKAFKAELKNLTDAELKDLASRHEETFSFFGSGNPYLDELVARIKRRKRIELELEKAKQEKLR